MTVSTKILGGALLGTTGLVTMGLLALPVAGAATTDGLKRDEDSIELVLVDDEDDDDTLDRSRDVTNDQTRSRVSVVSRDRDVSRRDVSRDVTNDQTRSRVSAVSRDRDVSRDQSRDVTR